MAQAALPPQYQRQAELVRIIEDQSVTSALQDEPITLLRMTGTDAYEVKSDNCTVTVGIVDTPTAEGMVGPRQFAIVVQKARCR